jgi:hypothetical protein
VYSIHLLQLLPVIGLYVCLLGASGLRATPPLEIVVRPSNDSQAAPHGRGNVYAPDIVVEAGVYRMWFGGQGRDGHDRIHLAESLDGVRWTSKGVVLEDEEANHVNDPSVVKVGETYFMYYTRAGSDVRDEIAMATSDDGVTWTKMGAVLQPTAEGWDSLLVGRPSVLVQNGLWRMWYDGRQDLPPDAPAQGVPKSDKSVRAVGYAESKDGRKWSRPLTDPVFLNDAGGVHVAPSQNGLVMVYESRDGTRMATSTDGRAWKDCGVLAGLSDTDTDRFGHVTPFLLFGPTKNTASLYFGASKTKTWDVNAIARLVLEADQVEARQAEPRNATDLR